MTKTWEEVPLFDLPVVPEPGYDGVLLEDARKLFVIWNETYHKHSMKYSGVRERRLIKGLKEFGFEACKEAILGMQYSEWHMGRNSTGERYTEVRVALRNEDSVVRFSGLYREHKDTVDW